MSDPKRLLDEVGGATEAQRRLLESGDDIEPPPNARDEVLAALTTRLASGSGSNGTGNDGPPGGQGGAGAAGSTNAGIAGYVAKAAGLRPSRRRR